MAKSPNTTPFKGISASFTYQYPNWPNGQTSWSEPARTVSNETAPEAYQRLIVEEELRHIDLVDRVVDSMLTYPEAESIIKTIMNQGGPCD